MGLVDLDRDALQNMAVCPEGEEVKPNIPGKQERTCRKDTQAPQGPSGAGIRYGRVQGGINGQEKSS